MKILPVFINTKNIKNPRFWACLGSVEPLESSRFAYRKKIKKKREKSDKNFSFKK